MTLEGISPDQLQMTDTPRLIWIPVREAVKLRWERNPKQHDLGALAESFRKHGFKQIPHYDSNIGVDDGNGRVECLDWMEKQGQPIVRGIATAPDRAWVMPLIVGVDDKSKALAEAYAIDANNLVLEGSNFSPWDMARLWDEERYKEILQSLAGENALPVTVDGEILDALMAPPFDPLAEWQGMPEFKQEDLTAFKSIIVHFDSPENVKNFAELVEQTITDKTKFIWYPKKEKENLKGTTYQNES